MPAITRKTHKHHNHILNNMHPIYPHSNATFSLHLNGVFSLELVIY